MNIQKDSYITSSDTILTNVVPRGQNLLSTTLRTIIPLRGAVGYDITTPDLLYVGDGSFWHPLGGGVAPSPQAYTFLYSVNDPAILPPRILGSTGVVEYETVDSEFTSEGAFVFEHNSSIPGNVTGISVPIEGDYQIDFLVNGHGIEGGWSGVGIATNGIAVPGVGTYATLTGETLKIGGESGTLDAGLVTGSIIMNLTTADILRVVNANQQLILEGFPGTNPAITSIRLVLLRRTDI